MRGPGSSGTNEQGVGEEGREHPTIKWKKSLQLSVEYINLYDIRKSGRRNCDPATLDGRLRPKKKKRFVSGNMV